MNSTLWFWGFWASVAPHLVGKYIIRRPLSLPQISQVALKITPFFFARKGKSSETPNLDFENSILLRKVLKWWNYPVKMIMIKSLPWIFSDICFKILSTSSATKVAEIWEKTKNDWDPCPPAFGTFGTNLRTFEALTDREAFGEPRGEATVLLRKKLYMPAMAGTRMPAAEECHFLVYFLEKNQNSTYWGDTKGFTL